MDEGLPRDTAGSTVFLMLSFPSQCTGCVSQGTNPELMTLPVTLLANLPSFTLEEDMTLITVVRKQSATVQTLSSISVFPGCSSYSSL